MCLGRWACDLVHSGTERRLAQMGLLSLRDHLMQALVDGSMRCMRRCFRCFHMLMQRASALEERKHLSRSILERHLRQEDGRRQIALTSERECWFALSVPSCRGVGSVPRWPFRRGACAADRAAWPGLLLSHLLPYLYSCALLPT